MGNLLECLMRSMRSCSIPTTTLPSSTSTAAESCQSPASRSKCSSWARFPPPLMPMTSMPRAIDRAHETGNRPGSALNDAVRGCGLAQAERLERRPHRGEGARAVAHAVLLGLAELGHREAEAVDHEERVVAEAAGALRH